MSNNSPAKCPDDKYYQQDMGICGDCGNLCEPRSNSLERCKKDCFVTYIGQLESNKEEVIKLLNASESHNIPGYLALALVTLVIVASIVYFGRSLCRERKAKKGSFKIDIEAGSPQSSADTSQQTLSSADSIGSNKTSSPPINIVNNIHQIPSFANSPDVNVQSSNNPHSTENTDCAETSGLVNIDRSRKSPQPQQQNQPSIVTHPTDADSTAIKNPCTRNAITNVGHPETLIGTVPWNKSVIEEKVAFLKDDHERRNLNEPATL